MNNANRKRSVFLTAEDYWAIWIGAFILLFGLTVYFWVPGEYYESEVAALDNKLEEISSRAPFKTIEWFAINDELSSLSSAGSGWGKKLSDGLRHPQKWQLNPLRAFMMSEEAVRLKSDEDEAALSHKQDSLHTLYLRAVSLEDAAKAEKYTNQSLNDAASAAVVRWYQYKKQVDTYVQSAGKSSYNLLWSLIILAASLAVIFGTGAYFMGWGFKPFIPAFLFVFGIAVIAHLLGNQADMKNMGFGYAIWAIGIGLLISNTIGTPKWVIPGVQTEYFIKTGLVLLGAEILFGKILAIGLPGIFIAWIVTPVVLVVTYWFGQRILKITSKSLNITISADMSVCGVSAAIATAAACKAKKEELTLAVGMSMVFTSIMMIVLPAFIKAVHIPEVLGGAWIGGTIDATGAVVAAGAFLGETALNVAATIKMIQNMLIGVIAFLVAVYWATRIESNGTRKVGASEIWHRFPKFIIGFVLASLVFSLLHASMHTHLSNALIEQGVIRGFTKDLRGWFFSLAFVSIGLSVNFKSLGHYFKGGKPLLLYLSGQALNIILTLVMAYLMFYKVFPEITKQIHP